MQPELQSVGRFRSFLRIIGESLSGQQHDFTKGPLGRAVALLAIPMVLEMAMESLFAICDIFFVAQLGSGAVAAVGVTESLLTLFYAVAFGLSAAATAMVARRVGENDLKGAAVAGAQAIYLGIGVSVLIGVPCFIFAEDLLVLMKVDPAAIEIGSGYTAVLLGTNIVMMLLFLNNAIFRGAGDPAVAMRSLWLANGIDIVLDPCLIFGLGPFPELGVTGAAIATTCGRGAGVLYQFFALHRGQSRIHLRGDVWRVRFETVFGLLRVSIGGIGQILVATASWVVLMRLVSPYGSDALAGYTIAIRIIVFAILPSWGLANAAATLVGQNLGAGQPERAEKAVWLTGFFNMVFLGFVTIVFVATAPWLISFFAEEEAVISVGVSSLRMISYGYIAYAWGMVLAQAFNGAGDTLTPTWINIFCFWVIEIPLAYALSQQLDWGPDGIFWSVAISESLLAVVALIVFRRGVWKRKMV